MRYKKRDASMSAKKLAFGIIWLLFGAILIGFVTNATLARPEEPPNLQGLPNDVPNMPVCTDANPLETNRDSAFVASNGTTRIKFSSFKTFAGAWYGASYPAPQFIVTSPSNGSLPAGSKGKLYGDSLYGKNEEAYPYMDVFFNTKDEYLHQWINAKAEMTIRYPVESGFDKLEENSKSVERSVKFYVLTPDELETVRIHNNWETQVSSKNNTLIGFALVVLIFFILPGIWAIKSARE